MGFAPQFKDSKLNIDYSCCIPVTVIAVFNQERKIKSLYFSLEDSYGDICKVKIDAVKYIKDGKGCTSFCCAYHVGGRQRECILTYYVKEHLWVMETI